MQNNYLCRQIETVLALWVARKQFAWTGFECMNTMWTYSEASMLSRKSLETMLWILIFAFDTLFLYKEVVKFDVTESNSEWLLSSKIL